MSAERQVLAAYDEGVEAIRGIAARIEDWSAPSGCDGWSATDLAGHLVTVADWWHEWLDRAQAGDAEPPFHWKDLDEHTAAVLAALPDGSGPERIDRWTDRARAYAERLPDAWALPFGAPPATVSVVPMTAGVHATLAAMEWNLHAFDLAAALGETYRPACADLLEGGLRTFGLPASDGDPWEALLLASGRTPR